MMIAVLARSPSSLTALVALVASLAVGCNAPKNERAPESSSSRSKAAADAGFPTDAASGQVAEIDAPGLDAPTVGLLRAAAKCEEVARCYARGAAIKGCPEARRCAAYGEWMTGPAKSAEAAGALVALLAHRDERVRDLAASRLAPADLDAALAKRALSAIGGERSERLATTMGELAALIAETHPAETHPDVAADVDVVMRTHPLPALRETLAYGVTSTACCGDGPGNVPKLKLGPACLGGVVKAEDAVLRSAGRGALESCIAIADAPPVSLPGALCADLMTLLDVRDDRLARVAVNRVVTGCAERRGEVLRRAARTASDGNAWRMAALFAFCAAPVDLSGSAADRKRAVTIAATVARTRGLDANVRAEALDVVEACLVNAGSDAFSHSRLYDQLRKDVEPAVWQKRRTTGADTKGRP